MESINISLKEACELHIFQGIPFHIMVLFYIILFYADDVTFIVNLHKNKVFGVGVDNLKPFTYLGLPIGANIRLAKHLSPIVDKFKRLIIWKQLGESSYRETKTTIKRFIG
uniref:Reverse transcriptase domain-containing protein n=1 Tax=Lactuca sativa TaxID=4236 RepID=A0A9R1WII2_LACSA|nr:hypothetical protein LSAT_V11C200092630 [Lactuca sativa]